MSVRGGCLLIAGLCSLALTLAYTAQYGTLNQATYLLDPIHRAWPELYRRDWFITDTPPYLPVFGWLVQWLYVLDAEGPVAILTAHVIVNLASFGAIYALVRALDGGVRAFAIVAGFVTVTRGISMGGSYLLVGYLQPSSVATLGWLIAMAAFARSRFVTCGMAAAFAGLLHANFLVLGVGLFGLAAFARRDLALRDYVRLLGPQLAVLLLFAPTLAAASGPSDRAVWILINFHAPVHYSPARMVNWIAQLASWQVGAFVAMRLTGPNRPVEIMWRFSLIACAIVVLSALVIRYTPLESLTQMRWSRIAPFGILACQAIIASALVRHAVEPRPLSTWKRAVIAVVLLVPVAATLHHLHKLMSVHAVLVGAGLAVAVLVSRPQIAQVAAHTLAIAVVVYALWRSPCGEGLTTTAAGDPDELAMMTWVRSTTPLDALFLAPPDLQRFRLLARRAVVVDTKSPPLRPDLLVAWYERMCSIARLPNARSFRDVEERYGKLAEADLVQIAHAFRADYIIARPAVRFSYPPVFRNTTFAVYRTPNGS